LYISDNTISNFLYACDPTLPLENALTHPIFCYTIAIFNLQGNLMSLPFINDAVAATTSAAAAPGQQAAGGGFSTIIMLVIFIGVFYFLLIRPQTKRAKEHQNLINNLQKGDEVSTSGGLLGRIVKIEDNIITLALNETTEIKIQKNAVVGVLPKGTLKS
jgi:preprotein translocase subunit YajC